MTVYDFSYTKITMETITDQPTMLAPTFLTAGNATFTADNGKGKHYTFKVRQAPVDVEHPTRTRPFFVSLLAGPDNTADYVYMGLLVGSAKRNTLEVRLTKASTYPLNSVPVKVLEFVLRVMQDKQAMPEGYQIRHMGACGMCGRPLTEPESLECGIGPICREKMAGGAS